MGKKPPRRRAPAPEPDETEKTLKAPLVIGEHSDATKARAIVAFRTAGIITDACTAAGIARASWYRWIEEDPAFADLVNQADEDVTDTLERRAHQLATAAEASERLIIFLLKARRRQKYGDRTELTLVSPDVRDRVQRMVKLIGSRKTWTSPELLELLGQVWQ